MPYNKTFLNPNEKVGKKNTKCRMQFNSVKMFKDNTWLLHMHTVFLRYEYTVKIRYADTVEIRLFNN